MKKLIIINGTMGVGKSTTCKRLNEKLDKSVFLDGDWCWNMDPFVVTEETKKMGMDNITYTLNNFLSCSAFDHVIFCWVIHSINILDEIISKLNPSDYKLQVITLTCNEETLKERIQKDTIHLRGSDMVTRSTSRLKLYEDMTTQKLDTSHMTTEEVVDKIITFL